MTNEQQQREIDYGVAIRIWKELLTAGIINRHDFAKINKLYIDRYNPNFCLPTSLYNNYNKKKSFNKLESELSP